MFSQKKRLRCGIFTASLVAICVVTLFGYLWNRQRIAVSRFLTDEAGDLTSDDEELVVEYVRNEGAYSKTASRCDDGTERDLIAAALKRVEVADDDSVLWEIAYQAQNGNGFEALPQLIADSVNSGMPNAHTALAVAYHPSIGPSLDELQVESILKKPGNEPVLATLIVVFGMDEMLQNKNSLNLLLQRTNLDPKIRLGLLKKIAREKQWSQWFASNRELIEVLRRDKSNEVAQFVDSQEE